MKNIKSFTSFKKNSSKGPKGKDLTIFVRFGGLDLKNQDGYTKNGTKFHSPPAPRGIYAFPKVVQELFLISSLSHYQPSIMPKEPNWNKLYDEDPVNAENIRKDFEKREKDIIRKIRKEFKKTTGNIWHHLSDFCKTSDIIDRHGAWVKTSIDVWKKAFSKSSLTERYGEDYGNHNNGRGENSINSARGIKGMYSGDHYEVFFDEKV